ncbi:MAG TPA: VIT family protein [Rudaea sp.]|nr:VIT family protein [Rudaea sp.]
MTRHHREYHPTDRFGWLRAAVLGSNDGVISTASIILGVSAAGASRTAILVAAVASLVAGATSMAAGEFVSVSSQADMEKAQAEVERGEIENDLAGEHKELERIYIDRGLTPALARQVAQQLMAHDALDAHLRDELGITPTQRPRPLQAALASACSYVIGALLPLLTVVMVAQSVLMWAESSISLIVLALLGGLAARAGGASVTIGALRMLGWGAFAMAATAAAGALFGALD